MTKPPATIDAWLEQVDDDQRVALQKLRKQIRAAAPRAVECINYGVPTFTLDGRNLAPLVRRIVKARIEENAARMAAMAIRRRKPR